MTKETFLEIGDLRRINTSDPYLSETNDFLVDKAKALFEKIIKNISLEYMGDDNSNNIYGYVKSNLNNFSKKEIAFILHIVEYSLSLILLRVTTKSKINWFLEDKSNSKVLIKLIFQNKKLIEKIKLDLI